MNDNNNNSISNNSIYKICINNNIERIMQRVGHPTGVQGKQGLQVLNEFLKTGVRHPKQSNPEEGFDVISDVASEQDVEELVRAYTAGG
jgi:hypothetical protein